MVVAADEQAHRLLPLGAGAGFATGAAAGGLKFAHRHALEIAVLGEHHDRALVGDQVDVFKAPFEVEDFSAPGGDIAGAQHTQFFDDQAKHPFFAGQDVLVVGDLGQ